MFLLIQTVWLLWHLVYPLFWLLCSCKKLGIHTAEEANPPGLYKPFGSPENPILKKNGQPYKVAIIGGGWTGLGMGHELKLKGVDVTIFEAKSKLGGTWNPDFTYHGLHIHGPMWITEGKDPYEESRRNACVSAREVYEYLVSVAEKHGIDKYMRLNSKVQRVCYDTATDKTKLEINHNGVLETVEGFDWVIFSGFACSPNMTSWPRQDEFKGRVLHISELSTPLFHQITEHQAKVVVVGGGKASVDILTYFGQAGHKNVTWLARSTYIFMHFHAICHDRNIYAQVRGFLMILSFVLSLLSGPLCALSLRMINCAFSLPGFTLDILKFHMGVLNKEHIRYAKAVPYVKSEIVNFTPSGVQLKNGKHLECDYVVCCLGYKTGVDSIIYEVNGRVVEWKKHESLVENLVSPIMPRMVFAQCGPHDLGMKRSIILADHFMSFVVRHQDPASVKLSLFGSRVCNLQQGANLDHAEPMLHIFLLDWLMLVYVGVLNFWEVISHMCGLILCTKVRIFQANHPKKQG